MKWLLAITLTALLILFAACVAFGITRAWADEPPRLYVVAARDTVMPGEMVTVGVYSFGVDNVEFDSGGLTVLTDTAGLPTRYLTLRASGPPRDVRVRAWAAGVEAWATIRVCCARAPDAVNRARRLFLPVLRH